MNYAATSSVVPNNIVNVDEIVTLNDVIHVNDERFFIALADTKGVTTDWLLDSGAAITAVDPSVVPEGTQVEAAAPNFEARSASNHTLVTKGVCDLRIRLKDKWLQHRVYVLEGLRTKAILGIDFIRKKNVVVEGGLGRVTIAGVEAASVASVEAKRVEEDQVVQIEGIPMSEQGSRVPNSCVALRSSKTIQVFPMSGRIVPLTMRKPLEEGTVGICADSAGVVTEALQEVQDGRVLVNLHNPTEEMLLFKKGDVIATFQPLKPAAVENLVTIDEITAAQRPAKSRSEEEIKAKLGHLAENFRFGGPEHFRGQFWQLIRRYEDVFSANKFDLGRTNAVKHNVRLMEPHPVHRKQFRIPWDHQQLVKDHIEALLKAKCIRTSRSPFNAPIFCVPKPHGGMRVVLDYRALNTQTYDDKYVIREVQECIDEIGKQGSRVFSALDLTSGFWQMELEEDSKPLTAFSFPGMGRFEWEVAPMGLKGSPASFARLMDHVMAGLRQCLTYIDDLLIHTRNFQQHLGALEEAFKRLRQFNLKLNITKCNFATTEVAYLGFHLTSEGVKPNLDKIAAVRDMPSPDSPKKIREFLGMSNYFRHFIKDYARIASYLSALTCHGITWKGGEMPPEAARAFEYLRQKLCEAPILTYPRADRPFSLSVDAATGDEKHKGGLGAVLTQLDEEGRERVIAYASKSLTDYEKNYSPFLLEMKACSWAIDHFAVYLKGRQFVLKTDHKPVEMNSRMHKRTLSRLQEQMGEYSFVIQHKPGVENTVPDALSRNVAGTESISFSPREAEELQREDPLVRAVGEWLESRTIPGDPDLAKKVQQLGPMCVLDGRLVRFCLKRKDFEDSFPLLAPEMLKIPIMRTAHASRFSGHGGIFRTFNNICRVYWWPGLSTDVRRFVEACPTCQAAKDPAKGTKVPLHPHEIPDRPNCRIHMDLFGDLKTASGQKKWIMVMTDAFTKYAEIIAIPNKEATTVAKALLERWICRFGCPEVIISDQGKEFLNLVMEDLLGRLGVEHRTTSAMRPQTNASAEKFNREIIRYLKTALEGRTLDWEEWLPMLAFSYNTQVHRATLNSPFFLTFLHDPRLPYFDMRAARPDYGESWPVEAYQRLRRAYAMAKGKMESERQMMKERYDKDARERPFQVGQQVLLHFPRATVTYGNPKLAPQWVGGYYVHQQLGPDTYWVRQVGSKQQGTTVHAARMKPVVTTQPVELHVPAEQPGLLRPGLAHLRGHQQGQSDQPRRDNEVARQTGAMTPQTSNKVLTRLQAQTQADEQAFPPLEQKGKVTRSTKVAQVQVQEQTRARSRTAAEEEAEAAQAVWAILRTRRKRVLPAQAAAQPQPVAAIQQAGQPRPRANSARRAEQPAAQPRPRSSSTVDSRGRMTAGQAIEQPLATVEGSPDGTSAAVVGQETGAEQVPPAVDQRRPRADSAAMNRPKEKPRPRSSSVAGDGITAAEEAFGQSLATVEGSPSSTGQTEAEPADESSGQSSFHSAEEMDQTVQPETPALEEEAAALPETPQVPSPERLWPKPKTPAKVHPSVHRRKQASIRRELVQRPAENAAQSAPDAYRQRLDQVAEMQRLARVEQERTDQGRTTRSRSESGAPRESRSDSARRQSTRARGLPPEQSEEDIPKNLQWGMKK
jgi:hypothetical protein